MFILYLIINIILIYIYIDISYFLGGSFFLSGYCILKCDIINFLITEHHYFGYIYKKKIMTFFFFVISEGGNGVGVKEVTCDHF